MNVETKKKLERNFRNSGVAETNKNPNKSK